MAKYYPINTATGSDESSSGHYTYYNKTFDDITDLFLYACSHGDYMLAFDLLQSGQAKADVSNRMGKTALQMAIENEHFEVVKVLLNSIPYEQFRDALLLAIYSGHTNIADYIMNHQTYRTFSGGFCDPTDPRAYDDSQFSSDITPLILAAQYNRLLIVHKLLAAGERIQKPHLSLCTCPECVGLRAADSFRQAQSRLSAYRGLASEVYIALAYPDPILQAFELGHELRELAKVEHYFGEEYKKLARQLSKFVARLLDNVRGHEELELILNKTGLPHEEKYETLARFGLAVHYREKPFVAHSNCQQKLIENWYEHIRFLKTADIFKRVTFYLGFMICYPFIAATYCFFPKSKIGRLCQQPNLKFKRYITSYFIFLGLIIASSTFLAYHLGTAVSLSAYDTDIYTKYIELIYRNTQLRNDIIGIDPPDSNDTVDSVINCDIMLRFMQPNIFQIAIFIWVIAFAHNESKQISSMTLRVYLKVPSNYVDCSMSILYIFYFIFLLSSMIHTRAAMNMLQDSNYWIAIANYNQTSHIDKDYHISKTRYILYWINADRFYWKGEDLTNLAEAFFAMGNIVSICRLCFLLPISAFVGPLQVMLDYFMINISKWIAAMIILFTAFTCSLYFLFSFYSVASDQYNFIQLSYSNTSSIPTSSQNSTTTINLQCPDYFYQLMNQSIPINVTRVDSHQNNNGDNSNSDASAFCQKASAFGTMTKVGHYPAIYYFGRSITAAILTTFFTLFGSIADNSVPDRGYELITLSCYKPDPSTYLQGFDTFMSNLGFILYGLFSFCCVTVLINTLIATMELTIEEIDDRSDIEWKYARSKLYMEYIQDDSILPIPLNIIPSPKSIMDLFNSVKQFIISKKNSAKNKQQKSGKSNTQHHAPRIDMGFSRNSIVNYPNVHLNDFRNKKTPKRRQSLVFSDKLTYKAVVERMVKRFLLYYKTTHADWSDRREVDQFKEIKNDISSLSFELFHEVESLYEVCDSILKSTTDFNKTLGEDFDLHKIKQHLKKQKNILQGFLK